MIKAEVFSTYVEVILFSAVSAKRVLGFLHVCGGDPTKRAVNELAYAFSPRMWR